MKRAISVALVATTLILPGTAPPAGATPCDQTVQKSIYKGRVYVFDREPSEESVYNNPGGGTATYSISYGRALTRSVTKHWEVGASGGVDWKIVKADISGKYGRSYVDAATTTKSKTITVPVKDNYTAWIRAVFYRRVVFWKQYQWIWDANDKRCEQRTIRKANWKDPKRQYVVVQKKGRHYP